MNEAETQLRELDARHTITMRTREWQSHRSLSREIVFI
jgi:hypothetical protein